MEGHVLSADAARGEDAAVLRRTVSDRRDQLHVLPCAQREDPRWVEQGDAGSVQADAQGAAPDHTRCAAARLRGPRPSVPRNGVDARSEARCAAVSASADAEEGRCRCSTRSSTRFRPAYARRSSSGIRRGWTTRSIRAFVRATWRCAWPTAKDSRRRSSSPPTTPTSGCATKATHADDISRWADTIREQTASCGEVFVYFKHEESGKGPEFARLLIEALSSDHR